MTAARAGLTRRSFGGLLAAAAVPAGAVAASGSHALDLTTPADRLAAWLKVYVSLERARVWYWYTGVIDAAAPGGPVTPMVGVSTLIRRDVVPLAPSRFQMELFEGTYFHPIGGAAPLERWLNPLNGREVRPFHYREGPFQVGYDTAGSFNPTTGARYVGDPAFETPWHRSGDQLWFSRDLYIDAPHPLPVADWPLESSGERETFGSFATHWASHAEVADPAVKTAASAFHYQAFMGWLPWLLMGQTPGRMLWRASGAKLHSLDDLPADAHVGFRTTHPRLFEERPWADFANMSIDYRRERRPAPR